MISRRDFLKRGSQCLLAGAVMLNVPSLIQKVSAKGDAGKTLPNTRGNALSNEQHHWGFICDTTKCIGCGRCVVACKRENNVPWEPELNRTWVERYVFTEDGKIIVDSPNAGRDGFSEISLQHPDIAVEKSFFVPKLCNHCEKPPCVTVCPVGASYVTGDGVILIDQDHCIGCRYCIQACPYGARFFLPEEGVVDKCTWCYHRIHKGLRPACVEACPRGARVFGDLLDPQSSVRQLLRDSRVQTLKPELGTEPKVNYIGLEKGIH